MRYVCAIIVLPQRGCVWASSVFHVEGLFTAALVLTVPDGVLLTALIVRSLGEY